LATYGLNSFGFLRPSLTEIVEQRKQAYRDLFGSNINTNDNSVIDKIVSIEADRENQVWMQMQEVYDSQTYQGAEGKYLDDLFSRRGIYRNGLTKATGSVEMVLNNTVPYNTTYSTGAYKVNSTFILQEDVLVAGNIFAHTLLNSQINTGSYTFTILNTTTSVTATLNLTLTNKTPNSIELNSFFNSIKTFIVDNTINENLSRIFIDNVAGSMYIGYTSATEMVGLAQKVDFKISPQIGNKTIRFDVIAEEAGLNPVGIGQITTITPQPSGYVSIGNIEAFFSGANIESDSEYRARASSQISSPAAATRSAIINGLLTGVDGVRKVKIFSNPTGTTSPAGIPPYKFIPVVYGGDTPSISQRLYELIACSNATYGTANYDIETEDGQVETIYHTKAAEKDVAIRVSYKTVQNRPLADSERSSITSGLLDTINGYPINPTLYNIQLVQSVTSAVPLIQFQVLTVEIKLATDSDSSYSSATFNTDIEDVLILAEADVYFNQIV
jgi:uncharacterized phage protein gp47/JayE